MTKTYREIAEFLAVAGKRLQEKSVKDSKFTYALRKVAKSTQKLWEAHLESREDLDVEHAATDEKTGVLLRESSGALSFTRDGMKARNKAIREAYAATVEIKPHAAQWPDDLSDSESEAFEGFVPNLSAAAQPEEQAG